MTDSDTGQRPAEPAEIPLLKGRLLGDIFLRSLAMQASWNSQRMQNLGLLVTLLPFLRRLPVSLLERRRFCRRHYEFFNTNPYLANFLVGGLLRLEGEHAAGHVPAAAIRTFKHTLARTYASLGDQLTWLGLKPTVLLLLSLLAILGYGDAILVAVLALTAAQLTWRCWALVAGYREGLDIVEWLARPHWYRAITSVKRAGMTLTGILAGYYVARLFPSETGHLDGPLLGAVALSAAVPLLVRQRVPVEGALFALLPLALLLTSI